MDLVEGTTLNGEVVRVVEEHQDRKLDLGF